MELFPFVYIGAGHSGILQSGVYKMMNWLHENRLCSFQFSEVRCNKIQVYLFCHNELRADR